MMHVWLFMCEEEKENHSNEIHCENYTERIMQQSDNRANTRLISSIIIFPAFYAIAESKEEKNQI